MFQFKSSANSVTSGHVHAEKDVERLSCGFGLKTYVKRQYANWQDSIRFVFHYPQWGPEIILWQMVCWRKNGIPPNGQHSCHYMDNSFYGKKSTERRCKKQNQVTRLLRSIEKKMNGILLTF